MTTCEEIRITLFNIKVLQPVDATDIWDNYHLTPELTSLQTQYNQYSRYCLGWGQEDRLCAKVNSSQGITFMNFIKFHSERLQLFV